MQFDALRRTTTFRLTALYGLLFALGTVAMLGLVYLHSVGYLTNRVDTILNIEADALVHQPRPGLRQRMAEELALNGSRISVYALFAGDGARIAGNLPTFPKGLRVGGSPLEIPPTAEFPLSARLIARRVAGGETLVVGRDISQLREMRAIIFSALLWSGITILLAVLALGSALSVAPLKRLKLLQDVASAVAAGDLMRRLPVTSRRDELDVLASAVNYMIGEVERLMSEVRGATEVIAHDLLSPLAHAAQQLRRIQRSGHLEATDIDDVAERIETVLERFRAILRITELDARQRRAGFSIIDLADVLAPIADLYQPLADAGGVRLVTRADRGLSIEGDAKLLFEALSNLVDNAIKFAGAGCTVQVFLGKTAAGPQIVVQDDGPGIPAVERHAVLQRFYRSERGRMVSGSGLGLSVVAAIVRLHHFTLQLDDAEPGVRAVMNCWISTDP
jgi:signal transduction histidine kinase